MGKFSLSQKPMPISIPQPGKLPEIEPIKEPISPKIFPEETPIVIPPIVPIEPLPYTVPKPEEF